MTSTFLQVTDNEVIAHQWEQVNSTLLARWAGGEATQSLWLAKAKPRLSQGEKRREEKSRVDKSTEVGANGSHPASKKVISFPNGLTDSEWLERLCQDDTYRGIDVKREHGKMMNWCKANSKTSTRRRFVNWLNRAERPLSNGQNHLSEPSRNQRLKQAQREADNFFRAIQNQERELTEEENIEYKRLLGVMNALT